MKEENKISGFASDNTTNSSIEIENVKSFDIDSIIDAAIEQNLDAIKDLVDL